MTRSGAARHSDGPGEPCSPHCSVLVFTRFLSSKSGRCGRLIERPSCFFPARDTGDELLITTPALSIPTLTPSNNLNVYFVGQMCMYSSHQH